jgi:hypothetical protein
VPKAGFKKWTTEETEFLEENWGRASFDWLAEKLGRDVRSIKGRARYIGLGGACDAYGYVTLTAIHNALFGYNPSQGCVNRLMAKGFPAMLRIFGKKRYRVVDLDKFWKWLEIHQDEISFLKFERYSLGEEPEWVDKKRRADWRAHNESCWSARKKE